MFRGVGRKTSLIGVAVSAVLLTQSAARAEMLIPLNWNSGNKNDDQLSLAMEQLYASTYNSQTLLTRRVTDRKGRNVEQVMRDEGVFFGSFFPEIIDSIMCDLNRHICRRAKRPVSPNRMKDVKGHVGGYEVSKGNWHNTRGDEFVIPAYKFEFVTTLKRTMVPPSWDPSKFHEPKGADCGRWGTPSCEDLVKHLNPKKSPSTEQSGAKSAVLPFVTLQATVPVAADQKSTLSGYFAKSDRRSLKAFSAENQLDATSGLNARDFSGQSKAWNHFVSERSKTDLGISTLGNKISPPGVAKPYGVKDETGFAQQKQLFELIHHPFADVDELPEKFQRPIPVVVIDTKLDEAHCEFAAIGAAGIPANCGQTTNNWNRLDDHGTHIYGIIAAKVNGRGIVGLNPYASTEPHTITLNRAMSRTEREDLENYIGKLARGEPAIANFSWGYTVPPVGAPLSETIDLARKNVLVVAAAGNDNFHWKRGEWKRCNVEPACGDKANIISVVGLDRSMGKPRLWKQDKDTGSNSAEKFDVAAIAEGVLSTISNNSLAHISGTSQAAAEVSAVASLVMSTAEENFSADIEEVDSLPVLVRNRLIYTADLFSHLYGDVFSGRLNAKRAIEIESYQVAFKDEDGSRKEVLGDSVEVSTKGSVFECRLGNGKRKTYNMPGIRRMYFDPKRREYTIFRHQKGMNYKPLERIIDCELTTLTADVSVLRDGNLEVFKIKDLLDYTAPMFR